MNHCVMNVLPLRALCPWEVSRVHCVYREVSYVFVMWLSDGFFVSHGGRKKIIHQVSRPISTGQLQMLPPFHTRPINVMVFNGTLGG